MLKNIRVFLVVILVLIGAACSSKSTKQSDSIQAIESAELKKVLSPELQLIDVRTKEEYEMGHIEYAKNISIASPSFEQDILNAIDTTKPVYVYCQAGGRSAAASERLAGMGFKLIYDLKGGYGAWE